MGAGWMRHLAGHRVRVFSAGSDPAESVNPAAVEVMAEVGIDISGVEPLRWTDAMVRDVDVVVSMGCGDECQTYPGTRHLVWELDDPAGQGVEMVRVVRNQVENHVRSLLTELVGEADLVGEGV